MHARSLAISAVMTAVALASADAKVRVVIPTIPDSPSAILRSLQIFSFRIDTADRIAPGPLPGRLGGYSRFAIKATVVAVYKGALVEADGDAFRATPLVYAGPILSRPAGLWVGIGDEAAPKPGDTFVAMCTVAATKPPSAAGMLSELGEGCSLYPAPTAADVELAVDMEARHATSTDAIAALGEAKLRSPLYFLEYVVARHDEALRKDEGWRALLPLLADSAISDTLRYMLVHGLDWIVSTNPGLTADARAAYILALVRAAAHYTSPDGAANLVETYVKNQVVKPEGPAVSAATVFKSAADDRKRMLELIRTLPPSKDLDAVKRWLAGS